MDPPSTLFSNARAMNMRRRACLAVAGDSQTLSKTAAVEGKPLLVFSRQILMPPLDLNHRDKKIGAVFGVRMKI